jgi:Flp pilus assembly pilin Flp
MTFLEYAQIVATASGAIIGVLAIGTKIVWTPIKSAFENLLDDRLRGMEDAMAELRPNGGDSVRDRIVRLEERQSGISSRLDDVYKLVQRLATKE